MVGKNRTPGIMYICTYMYACIYRYIYIHGWAKRRWFCVFRTRDTQKASMLEFHAGISSEVKKYCSFQVREDQDQDQDQRSSPLRCISFFQICFFFQWCSSANGKIGGLDSWDPPCERHWLRNRLTKCRFGTFSIPLFHYERFASMHKHPQTTPQGN